MGTTTVSMGTESIGDDSTKSGLGQRRLGTTLIVVAKVIGLAAGLFATAAISLVTSFGDCVGPDGTTTSCGTSGPAIAAWCFVALLLIAALLPPSVSTWIATPIYLFSAASVLCFGAFTCDRVLSDGQAGWRTIAGIGLLVGGIACAAGYLLALHRTTRRNAVTSRMS